MKILLISIMIIHIIACENNIPTSNIEPAVKDIDTAQVIDTAEVIDTDQEIELNVPIEEQTPPLTYLALGDSYTIGQGIDSISKWPLQLKSKYSKENINLDETIIAQTGWTSRSLLQALNINIPESNENESREFDLISISIGVNNQYRNLDTQIYLDDLDSLFLRAKRMSNENTFIFFVSIPDYSVTPFGIEEARRISKEIDEYNSIAQAKCNEYKIPFINITPISRGYQDSKDGLANDQLHPSAIQYERWVDMIYTTLQREYTYGK